MGTLRGRSGEVVEMAEGVWTFVAYRKRDGKEMVLTV